MWRRRRQRGTDVFGRGVYRGGHHPTGGGGDSRGGAASPPTFDTSAPSGLCPEGQSPELAAYEFATGELRWATCSTVQARRDVVATTDDIAYAVVTTAASPPVTDLLAVDARTGAEPWRRRLTATGPKVPGGPFLGGEAVVVAIDDDTGHALAGLDPATGQIRWTVPTDLHDGPIATTDDVVLIHQNTPPGLVLAQPPPSPGVPASTPAPPVRSCPEPSAEPSANTGPIFCAFDRSTGQARRSSAVQASVELQQFDRGSVDGQSVIVVPGLVALDAPTGAQLWAATRSPGGGTLGPVADGFIVWGGQDDPTSALDAASGDVVWTKPGSPAYDHVSAAGDGAVSVTVDSAIVANELSTGVERRRPHGPNMSWPSQPWYGAGETIFAMWNNLQALSTNDESTRWATDYPVDASGFPRMTAIASHRSVVIVGLGTVPSGGD